jgi:2'-5' RNA ligase
MARPITGRYFLGFQPPEAIRSQLELLCRTGQFGQGPFHHPLDRLLVETLWRGLAPLGFKPEQRPYRPHLTLGRQAGQPEKYLWSMATKVCWQVDGFGLFVSSWSGSAPRYRMLAKTSLRPK